MVVPLAADVVAEIERAGAADAYLRWRAASELTEPVLVADGHVAWCWSGIDAPEGGEVWATVVGDDPEVATRLVDRLSAVRTFDGITVRASLVADLPERLRPSDAATWCSWTRDVAGRADGAADVVDVVDLAHDDERIDVLLAHSPSAYIGSGDPRVRHWLGALDGDALVALGASYTESSGAAHLVSICTDPAWRGRRLAERIVRGLVARAAADGAPVVYLEMYANNDAARRLYRRLGFVEHPTYVSGRLPR